MKPNQDHPQKQGVNDSKEGARAYIRDAGILILDEPTAALDALAEYKIFNRFSELTKGKIAVLISTGCPPRVFWLEGIPRLQSPSAAAASPPRVCGTYFAGIALSRFNASFRSSTALASLAPLPLVIT